MKAVIAVSLLLLTIVTVLVVRRILKTPLVTKIVFKDIVSGSGNKVVVKGSAVPDLSNGTEFGYSFWLYLQPGGGSGKQRFVFAHTSEPQKMGGVRVLLAADSNMLMTIIGDSTDKPAIQYVPMSRWVHVVSVFANGTLTYYMDGEVHSVHAVNTPMTFGGPSGNLTIGGGSAATGGLQDSFQGYVGYMSFINFNPSPGLIKRLYAMGPTPTRGFFSMFGMHGYGVRSPVYKINNGAPSSNDVRL